MLNDTLKMHSEKSKLCKSIQDKQLCFFSNNKNWKKKKEKKWRGPTYQETWEIINQLQWVEFVWTLSQKVPWKKFLKILKAIRKFEHWIFNNTKKVLIFRHDNEVMVLFVFLFIILYVIEIHTELFADKMILSPRFTLV